MMLLSDFVLISYFAFSATSGGGDSAQIAPKGCCLVLTRSLRLIQMTMMPVIEASQRACICQGPPKWSQRNACGRHVRIQPTIPGKGTISVGNVVHGLLQNLVDEVLQT